MSREPRIVDSSDVFSLEILQMESLTFREKMFQGSKESAAITVISQVQKSSEGPVRNGTCGNQDM